VIPTKPLTSFAQSSAEVDDHLFFLSLSQWGPFHIPTMPFLMLISVVCQVGDNRKESDHEQDSRPRDLRMANGRTAAH
jgi:hypothetical protein